MKEVTSTRKEIERLVIANNNVLGKSYVDDDGVSHPPKVLEMNPIILLRNLHPSLRSDYARRLVHEEVITEVESKEFTKS
jgi:hypothetical protein